MAGTTTAQRIFDMTMGLIDEVASSGATDTADTQDYKNRTLLILNALRGEVYPYSDNFHQATAGVRPIAQLIQTFDDVLTDIDDYLAQSVMPYGLAAHLLVDENPASASFFQQRYEELLARAARGIPRDFEIIENVYADFEY